MDLTDILNRIEATSLATAVRQSTWIFPTVETIHVLAISLVVGTIAIVDLRLINVASRNRPVSALMKDTLPVTWIAFVCAVITGSMMFSSNAVKYAHCWEFDLKMGLLLLAGINMAVFHLGSFRSVSLWDRAALTPMSARVAGGVSLAIWITVVTLGRWIGFATNPF